MKIKVFPDNVLITFFPLIAIEKLLLLHGDLSVSRPRANSFSLYFI